MHLLKGTKKARKGNKHEFRAHSYLHPARMTYVVMCDDATGSPACYEFETQREAIRFMQKLGLTVTPWFSDDKGAYSE